MEILIISEDFKQAKLWRNYLENLSADLNVNISNFEKTPKYIEVNSNPDIIFIETDLEELMNVTADINCPTPLVIISSDASLCLNAFNLNTFNYLIKPVQEEDFQRSLEKYKAFYTKNIDTDFMGDLHSLVKFVSKKEKSFKKRFMIKIGNTIKSISVTDIAYFYSFEKINYLITQNGKKYPVENSLDEIEEMLNPENFYRANRQFIVNINAINEIHPYFKGRIKITLEPLQDGDIVVSSEKSRGFKDWLNK